jgi:hypothetical protein
MSDIIFDVKANNQTGPVFGRLRAEIDRVAGVSIAATNKAIAADSRWRASIAKTSAVLGKVRGALGGLGMGGLGGGLAGLTGGLSIGVAVRAFTREMTESFESIDNLGKIAFTLDTPAKEIQKLTYAAEQSDVEVKTLESSLISFSKNTSDTAKGIGRARIAFKDLGLDAHALMRMPLSERILAVSDALKKLGTNDDKVAAVMKMFGNADMIGLLGQERKAIEAMFAARAKMPGLLEGDDVAKIKEANDAWGAMKTAIRGAADEIAVSLAPAVEGAAVQVTSLFQDFQKWRDSLPDRAAGSLEIKSQQFRDDAARQGITSDNPANANTSLYSLLTMGGRALALNNEKKFREQEQKQFGSAIDVTAENAKRGLTPGKLAEIAGRNNAKSLIDLTNRIANDIPLRNQKSIDAITNALGDKAAAELKAEREAAFGKLTDGFDATRRAIPLALREAVGGSIGQLTGSMPRLKALAGDMRKEVENEEGEIVENKKRGALTKKWLGEHLPKLTTDALSVIPKLGAEGLAKFAKIPVDLIGPDKKTFDMRGARVERVRGGVDAVERRATQGQALMTLQSRTLTRGEGPLMSMEKNTASLVRIGEGQQKRTDKLIDATEKLIRKAEAKPKVVGSK